EIRLPLPPGRALPPPVVKMRKEVKRIRVLVIRKLVRTVARLKSKKGTEDALLKNQRRAQRLLEEIHAMKELKPDIVTKSALGDDISFEQICKKPDSTATERAVARLAVHPLLKKKIDVLKAAVQAFKDARHNTVGVESSQNTLEENQCKGALCSNDDASQLQQHVRTVVCGQKGKEAKTPAKKSVRNSKEKTVKMEHGPKEATSLHPPSKPAGKDSIVSPKQQKIPADLETKALGQTTSKESGGSLGDNSESEEESNEEEKEYFDDSTEERFYKQSSMSEESDSGDDFFIGKVRRTRKKESSFHSSATEQKPIPKVTPKENGLETLWDGRTDQSKPISEARKLESVFFQSLSASKGPRRVPREQAPKTKTPDIVGNEPLIKNQFKNGTQRGLGNMQRSHLPLHPSWEASRRLKEQQSKITVFQGKKITFSD
uniref:Serum response factor-binding protein 1 n=1 Tax=Nannospalax galili TaxID=1026970 RepID=A0A8C6W6F7_NANGA